MAEPPSSAELDAAGRGESRASSDPVRLSILGPLRVWRDGVELGTGPRQQAYLLALLLARAGRPTGTDELVDLIWEEDAPASAVNVIHRYVGTLRRLLEPTLQVRGAGTYILRRGTGYLFSAGPGALDLTDFRHLVAAARVQVEEQRLDVALDLRLQALSLWHGPAGSGLSPGPSAAAVFRTLDDEFLDACVMTADLAVDRGQPERVLAPLRVATAMAPFHEPVLARLVTSLGASGQQAEALSVFREARTRLADELGIEPGRALDAAHRRVLRQDRDAREDPHAEDGGVRGSQTRSAVPADIGGSRGDRLVGRLDELTVLRAAMAEAHQRDPRLVLVEGEPGVGKTRLLEELAGEASASNALVIWASCLEAGTPSMWPWVQVVTAVLDRLLPADRATWLASDVGRLLTSSDAALSSDTAPDTAAQLRLFEQVLALLGTASRQRPLVLVVDDLQWADTSSLRLLGHLAARLPRGVLVLGALRDRAPTPSAELTRMLAGASRLPAQRRLLLGPLGLDEVAELVRRETGQAPDEAAARSILDRTDGNPLFVRELSRLLATDGELTEAVAERAGVPATVRDIVLDLVSDLDEDDLELLQLAALVGRDVDVRLLAAAADVDIHTCLGRLETVEALGLLRPGPDDPFSHRFAHDLVREAVSSSVLPQQAAAYHLRIADALDAGGAHDTVIEPLAHHLWAAGHVADPARTVDALVRAGRRCATKTALDTAEHHLRSAVQVAQTAGLAESELAALYELVAVLQMSSPHSGAVIEHQERAENLAFNLGREEEATVLLYSRWMAFAFGTQYSRAGGLARRLLDHASTTANPIVRTLGLQAWGLQQVSAGWIGEGFRYLTAADPSQLVVPPQRAGDVVWYNQQLSAVGMLAETTAAHGDVRGARRLLDRLEAKAGDDPYRITIWAGHAARTAAVVGDPAWTLAATRKGMAADPELTFGFFGLYQRLAHLWASALTGHAPADAASELEALITEHLLDPPRMSIATWYGLLTEVHLAAGAVEEAAISLDLADKAIETVGQRYAEALIVLMRARLLQAQGRPADTVRAAATAAKELAVAREAHLFARRADAFLSGLPGPSGLGSGRMADGASTTG
nr:BTAD domain-containing putative transcriptional regulator [uncultured Nocardioides sp.]